MLAHRSLRHLVRTALVVAFAATLSPWAVAQKKKAGADAQAPAGLEQRFEDLHLTLRFPIEMQVAAQGVKPGGQMRERWTGKLAQSEIEVSLILLTRSQFGFEEPSDVTELIADNLADEKRGGEAGFHFEESALVTGKFGIVAYASLARSSKQAAGATSVASQGFYLGGLLEQFGYVVEVDATPALAEHDVAIVRTFLTKGVTFDGKQRDWKWTDAEAAERWKESVPNSDKKKLEETLRTAHYIILTNSSGGKLFAKKMEECYEAIKKVYPFDEVPGRRLMPVFLFQDPDEYFAFFAKAFDETLEMARRSKGVSYRDFYATWYVEPGDPVHIHEATHQIFRNRLGLGGGGSWFQEGVAEYMSTKDNERGSAARAVKKGRHTPMAEFVKVPSLLFSTEKKENTSGESEASSQYEQAALVVEFLRESKFGKDKFQDYIHAVGIVPRNDVSAINAALKKVYGVDIAGLEHELVEYCKKR
jgi:hypothetical protein